MVNPTQRNIIYFSYNIFNFSIKKRKKIRLIHFNEVTLVPTIFIFKFFFKNHLFTCRILLNRIIILVRKYAILKKYLKS